MNAHDPHAGADRSEEAALPHDRDEKPQPTREDGQTHANRAPVRQAHADVEAGVQDTERIGTASDVPSSAENDERKR